MIGTNKELLNFLTGGFLLIVAPDMGSNSCPAGSDPNDRDKGKATSTDHSHSSGASNRGTSKGRMPCYPILGSLKALLQPAFDLIEHLIPPQFRTTTQIGWRSPLGRSRSILAKKQSFRVNGYIYFTFP
jgi:hypothetical protein